MSGVVVVGHPAGEAAAACTDLVELGPVTLAWHDRDALLDADDLWANGVNALLVPIDDVTAAAAAMSHLLQVYGRPNLLVVAVDDQRAETTEPALTVARRIADRLPPTPHLVTGRERPALTREQLDLLHPWSAGRTRVASRTERQVTALDLMATSDPELDEAPDTDGPAHQCLPVMSSRDER